MKCFIGNKSSYANLIHCDCFAQNKLGLSKQTLSFLFIISLSFLCSFCNFHDRSKDSKESSVIKPYSLPAPAPLNEKEKKEYAIKCNYWYDSILKNTGFNGGILVAKNGNIIFEKYQGNAHLGLNEPVNNTTSFHIASVSKTFTAMAILKLWQEGKIDIDKQYSFYFPSFNYPGVTIRSLLSHRSGLPNYLYFMDELGWDQSKYITNQDVYDKLVTRKAELKDITSPNTHFDYCNTNYALLALLIEKISNSSYPQYIKTNFFEPLQMNHSFVFTSADSIKTTPSYDWRGQIIPLNYLDKVYGDKNIYSTVEDLLKWDRILSTNLLFTKETLKQAYTPYSNERDGIKNYGLGWRMNIYSDSNKIIFHNGWWHGNNAVFIRMIKEDATIILLGNRYNRGIYKAKNMITIFGHPHDYSVEE